MIDDAQAQKLRVTITSGGWREIMMPSILYHGKAALKALCMSVEERKEKGGDFRFKSDDQLRQIIEDSERIAVFWDNELNAYDMNLRRDQLRQQNGEGVTPDLSPSSLGAR